MGRGSWFQRSRHSEELAWLGTQGLARALRQVEPISPTEGLLEDGRPVTMFCTNDYLGLRFHHRVVEAGVNALRKWGAGTGASRLVSGNPPLYKELEERLAALKGAEGCLVFSSGYAANVALVSALVGRDDRVWADQLAHASLLDGALLSGARLVRFKHNEPGDLERRMGKSRGANPVPAGDGEHPLSLVLTEGVFSMDGDVAPLVDLHRCALDARALLVVDDAHGTGVLGPAGAGTVAHITAISGGDPGMGADLQEDLIQTGTLSKALASVGGFVTGPGELMEWLVNRGRSLMFSTGLPPSALAASLAALEVIGKEPWRQEAVAVKSRYLRGKLREMGYQVPDGETPIIPVITGSAQSATRLAGHLLERGVLAPAIRPPAVEPGKARIRISVCAEHRDRQMEALLEGFATGPGPDLSP